MKELFLENNGNEILLSVEFKIRDFKSVLPDNIESEHEMMMFCRSLAEELELFQKASKEMYSVLAETIASRLKGE